MAHLEISTTIGQCLDCSYCPQETIKSAYTGPRVMPLITFASALANCPHDLTVSFAGFAEPYFNRDCSTMIQWAARGGRRIMVYTTGIGMSDFDVDVLIRLQPFLMLHLPDGDGDMQAKVTPDYVQRMNKLARGVKGSQYVCYGSMHPALVGFDAEHKNYRLNSRAGNVTHLTQIRNRGPLKCRPAPNLDENVLLPDGRLALCCSDWGLDHIIGDLTAQAWGEIHDGAALNEQRRKMNAGESCRCQSCEFAISA